MARLKVDLKTLAQQERGLRAKLKQIRVQARAIERADRAARTERIGALSEKFGILHIADTVLAAAFKKLAAENPPPAELAKDAHTADGAGKDDARTQPVGTETAQGGSESAAPADARKRWPFGD